jgi:hypothetical protein
MAHVQVAVGFRREAGNDLAIPFATVHVVCDDLPDEIEMGVVHVDAPFGEGERLGACGGGERWPEPLCPRCCLVETWQTPGVGTQTGSRAWSGGQESCLRILASRLLQLSDH